MSIESAKVDISSFPDLEDSSGESKGGEEKGKKKKSLEKNELKNLTNWIKDTLGGKVLSVTSTDRLVDTPAIIVDYEAASMRRFFNSSRLQSFCNNF